MVSYPSDSLAFVIYILTTYLILYKLQMAKSYFFMDYAYN